MKKLALALALACVFGPASTHAQKAYITNFGDNTVSVINTATNEVIARCFPNRDLFALRIGLANRFAAALRQL